VGVSGSKKEATIETWTRAQCAEHWGIKPDTWSGYVSRGQAPKPILHVGRTPLWDADQVKGWHRPGPGARTDLKGRTMATTTSYGTWENRVDRYRTTVKQSVVEAFGAEGTEGFDLDAIVTEYREAINRALPRGVALVGDEFIGPRHPEPGAFDGYPVDDSGSLDIKAIVDDIDLWEIVKRHAVRNA
jgi:hypothetical protein